MERVTLTTLLHLTDTAVSDVCSMDGNVKRDAWMGDACLRMEFSRRLFALVPGAPIGELSQRRARLDQNVTMATFLLTATDLASRHLLQASSRSDHTLGTVFEALYQRAGIEGRRAFVDAYMSFADQRLDSRLVVDRVETRFASTDDTGPQETQQVAVWRWLEPAPILTGRATEVAQSDSRHVLVGMATVQHHAIVRMQSAVRSSRQRREMARTLQHAAVQAQRAASQAQLAVAQAQQAAVQAQMQANIMGHTALLEGEGHDWRGDEFAPKNITVQGHRCDLTWHGRICHGCGALAVKRKMTHTRVRFHLLGKHTCPRTLPATWLPEYNNTLEQLKQEAGGVLTFGGLKTIIEDELRQYGFLN